MKLYFLLKQSLVHTSHPFSIFREGICTRGSQVCPVKGREKQKVPWPSVCDHIPLDDQGHKIIVEKTEGQSEQFQTEKKKLKHYCQDQQSQEDRQQWGSRHWSGGGEAGKLFRHLAQSPLRDGDGLMAGKIFSWHFCQKSIVRVLKILPLEIMSQYKPRAFKMSVPFCKIIIVIITEPLLHARLCLGTRALGVIR